MPDINIASGGGGRRKYVIFTGLLPLCPKSSGQDCRFVLAGILLVNSDELKLILPKVADPLLFFLISLFATSIYKMLFEKVHLI